MWLKRLWSPDCLKEEHRWSLQRANSWCSTELVMDSFSKAAENILSTVTLHISFWVHLPVTNSVMCPTVHEPHKTMRSRRWWNTAACNSAKIMWYIIMTCASFCRNVIEDRQTDNLIQTSDFKKKRLSKTKSAQIIASNGPSNVHQNLSVNQCVTVTPPAWKDYTEVRAGYQYQYRFLIQIPIPNYLVKNLFA